MVDGEEEDERFEGLKVMLCREFQLKVQEKMGMVNVYLREETFYRYSRRNF
jgi:hypothetical protein